MWKMSEKFWLADDTFTKPGGDVDDNVTPGSYFYIIGTECVMSFHVKNASSNIYHWYLNCSA